MDTISAVGHRGIYGGIYGCQNNWCAQLNIHREKETRILQIEGCHSFAELQEKWILLVDDFLKDNYAWWYGWIYRP